MAANRVIRHPRWILATPVVVLVALPVAAEDLRPKGASHPLGSALAQVPVPADRTIPADITALEETVRRFYERGDYQKALEAMQQVMAWVDGSLPRRHPFRAKIHTWMGLLLSNVGRREEALAPSEEAVRIYRELSKTNPAYLPNLAMALNNLGVSLSELGRREEALAPTEEAVRIYRELSKTNPAYLPNLAMALNNLGYFQRELGQPEIARIAFEESITILRPLAASNAAFQEALQRALNNLDNLNREDNVRTGAQKVLAVEDVSYLPKTDPLTPVKRAVVKLWTDFSGTQPGSGLSGAGFVVKRQGDRAWIATALHVVRDAKDSALATNVEAEIYTGPLPPSLLPPRLQVVLPPVDTLKAKRNDLIILEIRGLPPDLHPLPLTTVPPTGTITVVGHPTDKPPWTVSTFPVLKSTERQLVLDGQLNPGASGSPVLNAAGQVLGLIYETSTYEKQDINFVFAYRTSAIQSKLP